MTLETGSNRHPAGHYESEAIEDGAGGHLPGAPVWVTWRTLDPIRGAALAGAVHCYGGRLITEENAGMVLDLARTFEAYLTGEGADGDPGDFATERASTER